MQQGSLTKEARRFGSDLWSLRWRERDGNGKTVLRRFTIGTTEEYKTEAEACQAIVGIIREINSGEVRIQSTCMTIAELAEHFRLRELGDNNSRRSFWTKRGYHGNLRKWIVPRWGTYQLKDVKAVEVEAWLGTLDLANNTKRKLRDLMHQLYTHAYRYSLCVYPGHNPIQWVRQSGKRRCIPDVLTVAEIAQILAELPAMEYAMFLISAILALRRSEIFALKWKDIDFQHKQMNVRRSIVCQVLGSCKTEASTASVPLHDVLAEALEDWRNRTSFVAAEDWVFASPFSRGKKPFWPNSPLIKVKKIANRLGIHKRIGWHTFRRTFATELCDAGTNLKVLQDLLRHGSITSTMQIYAQAVTRSKRKAQKLFVRKVLPKKAA